MFVNNSESNVKPISKRRFLCSRISKGHVGVYHAAARAAFAEEMDDAANALAQDATAWAVTPPRERVLGRYPETAPLRDSRLTSQIPDTRCSISLSNALRGRLNRPLLFTPLIHSPRRLSALPSIRTSASWSG
jgi:hypothetical protein